MPYSLLQKMRLALGDPAGVMTPGTGDLQALLDRGSREVARRGLLYQARQSLSVTTGVRVYTLPNDHIQTFTLFQGLYSVSVRLLSQDGHIWWLTVSETGILALTDTAAPAGHILSPQTETSWLELTSPDATRWYVYPSPVGTLLVSTTQPATGTGTTSTVQLRDPSATPWYLSVSDVGTLITSMSGSATLVETALDDRALQRVEVEAIERIDPRDETGPPRRYALAGKLLYLHPTPDLAYQLDHKYFSDLNAWQPAAAQFLPVLYATAMSLAPRQRLAASEMLREQWRTVLTLLATNLAPSSRDAQDSWRMPTI